MELLVFVLMVFGGLGALIACGVLADNGSAARSRAQRACPSYSFAHRGHRRG